MEIEWIESNNYKLLQPILDVAYEHNQLVVVIGDSGWGKSWNFEVFGKRNKNVFRDEIESTMDTKILFNEILQGFNRAELTTNKLFYAIRNASNIIRELKSKSMYIIDEAGNFKMSMHRHIRDFRKHTKDNAALVLSGPYSFYDDLEKHAQNNKYGIKELMTRVDRWVFLKEPTVEELVSVFKVNGFNEKLTAELVVDCKNFRDVQKTIINYWIDHGINADLNKDVGLQA